MPKNCICHYYFITLLNIIIIRTTPFDARQDPFYGTYDFHVLQGSIFQQCPDLVQKDHKKVMLRMRSKLLGLDFETVFQM